MDDDINEQEQKMSNLQKKQQIRKGVSLLSAD